MSDTDHEVEEVEEPASVERGSRGKRKVKVEGDPAPSFIDPLYAEQPKIVWNRVDPILRDAFEKEYGLCNKGLAPKRLRFGVHLEESEVEAVFGPRASANGYRYANSEDVEWVKKIELIWMQTHQRTQVPNTRMINLAEAKGLVYEKKANKQTNWCVHAEWCCGKAFPQYFRIYPESGAKRKKFSYSRKE